jgi:hypothetical protein
LVAHWPAASVVLPKQLVPSAHTAPLVPPHGSPIAAGAAHLLCTQIKPDLHSSSRVQLPAASRRELQTRGHAPVSQNAPPLQSAPVVHVSPSATVPESAF